MDSMKGDDSVFCRGGTSVALREGDARVTRVLHEVREGGDGCPEICGLR